MQQGRSLAANTAAPRWLGRANHLRSRNTWILAVFGVLAALLTVGPIPARGAAEPTTRLIRIEARMFDYSPNILHVNQGDHVVLELAAMDVVHGLYVDGYEVETTSEPGVPARVEFTADRAGKFRYRCSVSCGAMHPFMIGELIVGPNTPYWRAVGVALLGAAGALVFLATRRQETAA
jgi:cytochrome c oxidase subunit 2